MNGKECNGECVLVVWHGVFSVSVFVIRLADMDGQAVLDAQQTGLLPFTPLMKPPIGVDADEWLHPCIHPIM